MPELVGHPAADLVLVNDDDLTYAKLRLDERSLATLRTRIGAIPDPLARALCWSAAWDMTRDAELPAREWVQLVLAGVDAETEISVVQSLLARVQTALTSYADPSWAPTGWTLLADHALAALEAAPAGSDAQLQWSRTFASAARTDEHADVLRGLLDGSRTLEGLEVDADARWAFLSGLVAIGAAGDAEIDAEAERDATATGVRRAATARALRPDRGVEGGDLGAGLPRRRACPTPCTRRCCWASGTRRSASSPPSYVERYFADIRPLWDRRPGEIAKNAVQYLFPPVVEPRTIVAADAWLADAEQPAAAAPAGLRGPRRHRPRAAGPGARRRRAPVSAADRGRSRRPEASRSGTQRLAPPGRHLAAVRSGGPQCAQCGWRSAAGCPAWSDIWRSPLTMPPTRSPAANEPVIDSTASAQARSGIRRAAAAPVTTSTTRCPGETAISTDSARLPPDWACSSSARIAGLLAQVADVEREAQPGLPGGHGQRLVEPGQLLVAEDVVEVGATRRCAAARGSCVPSTCDSARACVVIAGLRAVSDRGVEVGVRHGPVTRCRGRRRAGPRGRAVRRRGAGRSSAGVRSRAPAAAPSGVRLVPDRRVLPRLTGLVARARLRPPGTKISSARTAMMASGMPAKTRRVSATVTARQPTGSAGSVSRGVRSQTVGVAVRPRPRRLQLRRQRDAASPRPPGGPTSMRADRQAGRPSSAAAR